jgi:serine/threonine protein phosphatase PrpC
MILYKYSTIGKRDNNEDQYITCMNINEKNANYNKINLLGVFDGHGGGVVSKFLKNIFIIK